MMGSDYFSVRVRECEWWPETGSSREKGSKVFCVRQGTGIESASVLEARARWRSATSVIMLKNCLLAGWLTKATA